MMEELIRDNTIKTFLSKFHSKDWKSLVFLLIEYSIYNIQRDFNLNKIKYNDLVTMVNSLKSENVFTHGNEDKYSNILKPTDVNNYTNLFSTNTPPFSKDRNKNNLFKKKIN